MAGQLKMRDAPDETTRLSMRRFTLDDADLMLAIWNDPDFIRHVTDRGIRTQPQARDAIRDGIVSLYDRYGYGPYRVALRADDTPIGICGLFRREDLADPDLGFTLLPGFRGLGLAYEAATAVLCHARDVLGIDRVLAIVSPGNAASVGLIEKLGFRFERMHRMHDSDVAIYESRICGQDRC